MDGRIEIRCLFRLCFYTTWSFLGSGVVPTERRTTERRIMQVNSSVSNWYYTHYQAERRVKHGAGFTQTEAGKITSNEARENKRRTESVDYQEFYKALTSQIRANSVQHTQPKGEITAASESGAVTIAETEDKGEFLGLTMVPEEGQSIVYGMRAMLSDKSTPDNPIVQVVSNLGGENVIYNVEVNKVNPNNASQLEMFALLSYTDKMGITDGGTFGSHQQLEVYGGNASSIGFCNSFSGADAFLHERFDWGDIMGKMVQVYLDAGIHKQAEDCKALLDFFDTTFQIGVQSFTEKEWEEFLDKFDSAEEAIQELMKEEQERREAEETKKWNMSFAASESFWNDFLNDDLYRKF